MHHFHCPRCGSHLDKVGRVPVLFPRVPSMHRENLARACRTCACVIEINKATGQLFEFHGLRLAHLRHEWPGVRFLDHTLMTPRGVSWLYRGES